MGTRRWIFWFSLGTILIIIYKFFDNFSGIGRWIGHLFAVLAPFLAAIIISYVLSVLLNALRTANQKCTDLGWNGPQGLCGTYIYKSSEKILEENGWEEDDSSIVRMPDGRIYTLHEGD